jgi:FkbM family methyltransferase
MKKITSKVFRKTGNLLIKISNYLLNEKKLIEPENYNKIESVASNLIQKGQDRDLYKTRFGDLLWLKSTSCIDESIIKTGIWEDSSTDIVNKLVKPNDYVIDIGANIGYFTVLFSKIVGENGKVYAFEPTNEYYNVLNSNLKANNISNCVPFQIGLSDKEEHLNIFLGQHSATIHEPIKNSTTKEETINLTSLDKFVLENKIEKIDFIKIDVDGHEPKILEGATKTLERFKPIILLEVNHLNYFEAGYTASNFYNYLKQLDYFIYSEKNLLEIANLTQFLIECGNYAYSSNIIITKIALSN